MFEFHQAKRRLDRGGLVVNDNVSCNASVWDFAEKFGVPSYNFKQFQRHPQGSFFDWDRTLRMPRGS
jgi:hypothetical protein